MSGILECRGVFQLPLADGWSVRGEPGRSYDISHDTQDVGVNISVYARSAVGDDINGAIVTFAAGAGADPNALSVTTVPAPDHGRAFVRFDADDRTWLAAFVYINDAAVLITSNCPQGDDAAFRAGEVAVASLGPLPKRRRFGRR